MKLSPTVPLALAFAAGIAGAAMAQNSAVSGTASTSPQTTAPMSAASPTSTGPTTSPGPSSFAQPQQNAAQTQPGSGQMQPLYGQAQAPNNAPNNANEQVRTAQQQLHAAGLYNGPVDGVMDPDTRAALARFQQQNGLRRTESLDQQTLARLQSSQAIGSEPGAPATAPVAPTGSSGNAPPPASAGGNTPAQIPGQPTQR